MALNVRKAGALERGVMATLIGERGSGKTTLAASLPAPLVLAVEDGTQALAELGTDVVDVVPANGQAMHRLMLDTLREVAKGTWRTVVVDSVTALLAKMAWDLVKNEPEHKRSLGSAGRGYFEARDRLVIQVEELVAACLWLARERKMHVVFVAHQHLKTVSLPDREDYERIEASGERKCMDAILNPCDLVAGVEQSMTAIKQGEKVLVRGDGSRQLVVGPHPAMQVKSRWHRALTRVPITFGENPLPEIFT